MCGRSCAAIWTADRSPHSPVVLRSNLCKKNKMAGRPRRIKDIALAERLNNWRLRSGVTRSFVAKRLEIAPSTLTRTLETSSFSTDLRERVLVLLREEEDAARDAVEPDRFLDSVSEKDLLFLRKFVNHILPKVEEVLKSALRRPPVGDKS
jgi:transcriptional regulator with XRE-family HTH domain